MSQDEPKETKLAKPPELVTDESSRSRKRSESSLDETPTKRLKLDEDPPREPPEQQTADEPTEKKEEDEKTQDEAASSKDDFTKPSQVRKKVRRNTVRSKTKSGRAKFPRKRPHGGLNTFKRRKKEIRVIVPPTKFLLGGNINDPLNLKSFQDEEINRAMNAVTPKSSPLPTPKHRKGEVEVIVPRNKKDPLHLTSGANDAEYMKLLSKKKRKRKRKRGNSGSGSGKEESFEAGVPVDEPSATVEGAFVPPDTLNGMYCLSFGFFFHFHFRTVVEDFLG